MKIASFVFIFIFSVGGFSKTPENFAPTVVPPLTSSSGAMRMGGLEASANACNGAAQRARLACLSELNPKIQTAAVAVAGLLGVAKMANSSTAQSCGNYNKALKIAETAVTAYNTMCTAAQALCASNCSTAQTTFTEAQTSLMGMTGMDSFSPAEMANLEKDATSLGVPIKDITAKVATCEGYKMNLAAAGVGLASMLKQSAAASQCQASTTAVDCTTNPNDPSCMVARVDCGKPENQSLTQCICERAPNTSGCPGAIAQSSTAPVGRNIEKSADAPLDINASAPSSVTDSKMGAAGAGGSGAGAAGLPGGAAGGGGGLGGGNGKAGAADGTKNKALNANILSGYEGGGGGGGGRSGSGRDSQSAYNAYLPGGAKDPSRGVASKTFGNGEVTAAGSKSNWQKVSERYIDNKPTLMGP